ncbi:MAG: PEP-utilizing enzyme [Desulfobulbaceae bacterium]|nr:PEP-utilizing enzyme [Desulfobulbaceae bacterium]
MSLLHLLRKMLPWPRPATDAPKCHPAKLVFERFRRVLTTNNRALTIIADMGEKLSGDFLFDQRYIETSVDSLTATVKESIDALNDLTDQRHPSLAPIHARLSARLRAIMDHRDDREGPQLLSLNEIKPLDWAMVGGKNAHLAEMIQDPQLKVPEGFVITTRAYHDLIDANHLRQELDHFETMLDGPVADEAELERLRCHLEAGILAAQPPPEFIVSLEQTLAAMRAGVDQPLFLAIRSSAQEEDLDFSFAGQFRSILNVPAESAAVFDAYRQVAASLFGARPLRYRRELFPEEGRMSIAAGCQRMIDSRASGVAYTVDTMNQAAQQMVIVGAWGQGESVVEGSSPTDTFIVAKQDPHLLIHQHLSDKASGLYLDQAAGLALRAVPEQLRTLPCLSPEQRQLLCRQAIHLENYYKRPQDIEWAVDQKGELYILQTRPLLLVKPTQEQRALPEILAAYPVIVADRGRVAQQGIGCGPVYVVHTPEDLEGFPEGGVLVSRRDSSHFVQVMHRAAAIVTEIGTPVSHMATLCRELRVPCLVTVDNILALVTEGEEITVDADDRRIYRGRVPELITYQAAGSMNLAVSREFRLLRRLLQSVSRLHLVDPLMQNFTPEGCQTFHDILRFTHETAVTRLVEVGRDERCLRKGQLARKLDLPIPAGILVIDIDDGVIPEAPADNLPVSAIASIPFRAILEGMLFPEVWHRQTMPVGMKDLMSSMLSAPSDALSGQYSGHNIAVISREYVNLCFRFGYHFNIIDAHCSERERDNHIYFRFLGGATDMTKRSRRAKMIAAILEAFDFNVRTKGDLVIARAGNMVQSEMERSLDILGRLVGFTRQLDVRLDSDAIVDRYVEAFLSGDYGIVSD